MTRPAPFTAAQIARDIRAADQAKHTAPFPISGIGGALEHMERWGDVG